MKSKSFVWLFLFIAVSVHADCDVTHPLGVIRYVGECKNGVAHGTGQAHLPSVYAQDGYYVGSFVDGRIHGQAKYVWGNSTLQAAEYFVFGEKVEQSTFMQLGEEGLALRGDELKKRLSEIEAAKHKKYKSDEKVRRDEVPLLAKKLARDEFCITFGRVLRGEPFNAVGDEKYLISKFQSESNRRGLRISEKLIKEQKLRMGMSECEIFASWGTPDSTNRSVGSWGVHIQWIYGNNYIYTENGRLSAWQD